VRGPLETFLRGINASPRYHFRDDLDVDHRPVRSGGLVHAAFTFYPDRGFVPGLFCEGAPYDALTNLWNVTIPTVTAMPKGTPLTCVCCVAKYARR